MKGLFILLLITLNFLLQSQNCSTNASYASVGQSINFSCQMSCSDSLVWNFGDSTEIFGIQHPTYSYSSAGTYVVAVYCPGDTCKMIEHIGTTTDVNVIDNTIHCSLIGYDFDIFTLIGQKVLSGIITNNNICFLKGSYIIVIQKGNKTFVKKLLIYN